MPCKEKQIIDVMLQQPHVEQFLFYVFVLAVFLVLSCALFLFSLEYRSWVLGGMLAFLGSSSEE